ncbi:hypothetical protein D3C72_2246110 [compost metagenome]
MVLRIAIKAAVMSVWLVSYSKQPRPMVSLAFSTMAVLISGVYLISLAAGKNSRTNWKTPCPTVVASMPMYSTQYLSVRSAIFWA